MHTPTIETERLLLRPPRIEDAEPIFNRYAQDPQVTRYLTWRPHLTVDETRDYISKFIGPDTDRDPYLWTITRKTDSGVIGMIELTVNLDTADFGYVLARSEWGRGIATEALRRVIEFGFSFPEVMRIWGVCDVENRRSARVMEKAGLTLEGILPSFISHPNMSPSPRDVHCYSIKR